MAQARSIRWPALLLALGVAATWVVVSRIGPEEDAHAPRRLEFEPPVEAEELAAELERDDARVALAPNRTKSGATVLLIDAATKAPIVGANVRWIDARSGNSSGCLTGAPLHAKLELCIDEHGRDHPSDGTGSVVLPWTDTIALVEASHGDLEGRLELSARASGEFKLELGPSRDLHVRVVDASGTVVEGIEMGLFEESSRLTHRTAKTDRSGIARLRDAAEVLPSAHVRVHGLFSVTQRVLIESLRPRSDPIEIRIPPTGRVRVVVEGPLPNAGRASLSLKASAEEVAPTREFTQVVEFSSAEAIFDQVGLGLDLELRVSLDGEGETREHSLSGPVIEGEEVRFVVGARDRPAIVFRLLAADGTPLVASEVRLELLASLKHLPVRAEEVATDAEGRLRRALGQLVRTAEGRALRIAHLESWTFAELDLDRAFPGGDTDLGDVRLAPIPVIAAGRVIDEVGAPVHFASVAVEPACSNGKRDPWLGGDRSYTTSARDGSFELSMPPLRHAVALRVMKGQEYFAVPAQSIQPGETGIEIVLRRAASVEGRVLRPNELADAQLKIAMVPIAVHGGTVEPRKSSLMSRGGYRVGKLVPGRWRLSVQQNEAMPVFQEEIEVAAGRNVIDTIDLSAVLRAITITLVDDQGREISGPGVRLAIRHAGSSDWSHGQRSSKSRFVVFTGNSAIDVFVHAPGHEASWLLDVNADQRIVLRPGIPLRVVVKGEAPLSDPTHFLSAGLVPLDPRMPPDLSDDCSIVCDFQDTRKFTGVAALPGRYRVDWAYGSTPLREGRLDSDTQPLGSNVEYVEVPKDGPGPTIEITAPADGLERARAAQLQEDSRPKRRPR